MTNEDIVKDLAGHEHEIKNLGYRIGNLEAVSKQINELALSVQKLALNMARMLDEQKILSEEQKIISGRVRNLEDQPGQTWGIIDSIVSEFGEEIEIIDSYFEGAPVDVRPLWFIGKAIELLSTADMAYFAPGWKDARGCRIEHKAVEEYGIEIICDGREGCNAGERI